MTEREVDDLSLKEARVILKRIFKNPLLDMYMANQKQILSISNQINDADIKFDDEDSDKFDNFLKWNDKALKMVEAQDAIKRKIDPSELERERKKRLAPDRNTPEYYAKRRKDNLTKSD